MRSSVFVGVASKFARFDKVGRLDHWTLQRHALPEISFAAHMLRLESFGDMLMMLRLRCRWAYPVAYSFLWRRFSESYLRDSKYVFETASLKS